MAAQIVILKMSSGIWKLLISFHLRNGHIKINYQVESLFSPKAQFSPTTKWKN